MDGLGEAMLVSAGVAVAWMLIGWLSSLALRDISIVDVAWGLGFVAIGWAVFLVSDGAADRKILVVALVTVWGLRLSAYLAWRHRHEGSDFRYEEIQQGGRPGLVSLGSVFATQALGLWVVSLPLLAAMVSRDPAGLGPLDFAGVAVWGVGMVFEAGGDLQLARFRSDPSNFGEVMETGLWRYTRHPNYFGDFCVWWGIFLIGVSASAPLWTIAGPLMMTCILLRISGVAVMERHLDRKFGYRDYVERTSAFFPRPPRDAQ